MDPERQIRLLVAPFFFFISLLMAYYLPKEPNNSNKTFSSDLNSHAIVNSTDINSLGNISVLSTANLGFEDTPKRNVNSSNLEHLIFNNIEYLISFIAISLLPVGFLISTITILLLKLLFRTHGKNYEICNDPDFHKYLTHSLNLDMKGNKKTGYLKETDLIRCANVAFDHGVIQKNYVGIHGWNMRTYSFFIISCNCIVSIMLAWLIIGISEYFHPRCSFWILSIPMVFIMAIGAYYTRDDLVKMQKLQAIL